jgi:hypothetical protein
MNVALKIIFCCNFPNHISPLTFVIPLQRFGNFSTSMIMIPSSVVAIEHMQNGKSQVALEAEEEEMKE